MPETTAVWKFDDGERDGLTVIGPDSFCGEVFEVLSFMQDGTGLVSSPTGYHLLRRLTGYALDTFEEANPLRVTIRYRASPYNTCVAQSYALAQSAFTRALALGNMPLALSTTLFVLFSDVGVSPAEFADQISKIPDYRSDGLPTLNLGATALRVTEQHVLDWLQQRQFFPLPFVANDALLITRRVKILLSRYETLRGSPGSSCTCYWNLSGTLVLSDGTVQRRQHWLGLAHELVRAYYNLSGGQLDEGEKDPLLPDTPMVLGRCMAVGLGPWKDAEFSENAIRRETRNNLRIMY
jgi:hypothetical protein